MRHHQSGMALIAVLLFLILITIAGVVAVRQSSIDLKVAASDQADALMLNNSDSVLSYIEQAAGSPTHDDYTKITAIKHGILGYYIRNTEQDKTGDQLSFCYRKNTSGTNDYVFDFSKVRMFQYGRGQVRAGGDNATCDSNNPSHYSSDRHTVMTQVAIVGLGAEANTQPFASQITGEQIGTKKIEATPYVSIHSVSVLPALSDKANSKIMECLSKPVGEQPTLYDPNYTSMTTCLRQNGIPATALVEDGAMVMEVKGGFDPEKGELNNPCDGDAKCAEFIQKNKPTT